MKLQSENSLTVVKNISKITNFLNSSIAEDFWTDWKWQVKHSIRDIETFEKKLGIKFPLEEKIKLQKTIEQFPMSITPYYLSLIEAENYSNDPIFRQAFPSIEEMNIDQSDLLDPLGEDKDSPVTGITHRYPDRVLFHISNRCAMYCRHCTRKRKVGDVDFIPTKEEIMKGIEYIRKTHVVRDVLLSGGDPFMLPDEYLDWILTELENIPHVEIIRIGTRTPVVLPFRITDDLIKMLKRHKPIWINTHFNHPREIVPESIEALNKLADSGIPLGNQSVLLAGVNDCTHIMKKLVRKLTQNRVRPYYLYQCDLSIGLSHFRTPVGKGIEIIEGLRGHTSGFAIPTYVVDAPGGGGKIPVMPNYLISWSNNKVILRNFEGVITTYKEPDNYEHNNCALDCDNCNLYLKMESPEEVKLVGIKKLLADSDNCISLTPDGNERIEKRKDE
ncbi:MAG TPA: lysine 2,3-aminomutase [Cyanobacteria bacterium UBA9971]|nr:lysine 2,3-aminomutase [Cyanobacteria bacterium UBA9971]